MPAVAGAPELAAVKFATGGLETPPPSAPLDKELAEALNRLRRLHAQQRVDELARLQARVRLRHFAGIVDEVSESGATALHDRREAELLEFAAETAAAQVVLLHQLDQRLRRIRLELVVAAGRVALARRSP